MSADSSAESTSHPLLSELKGKLSSVAATIKYFLNLVLFFLLIFLQPLGVIRKIKLCQQPVTDGKEHLIPLCETLEAIFRNGLKSALFASFGLNGPGAFIDSTAT